MKKVALLALSFVAQLAIPSLAADKIVLYTDRVTARFQAASEKFTQETGATVEIVEKAYPQLLAQIQTEGEATPADLIMTKDLVYLTELADLGWLKPYNSQLIDSKVIAPMKHAGNLWAPVTFRTRAIVYNPSMVSVSELSTYEDLANEKWAGRLCLRTSNHGYNEALVADLITRNGYDNTLNVVNGWVQNLALDPIKNDVGVIENIAAGACDVGIVNHYYLAQVVAQKPNLPVKIFFPNQGKGGAHTNGAAIALTKTTQNEALATKFMEILFDDSINAEFAAAHFDYSAIKYLAPTTLVKDWGTFQINPINWYDIGQNVQGARNIFKETSYK